MANEKDELPTGVTNLIGEVEDDIKWYDRKKRPARHLHRATTVAVIVLGATIPVVSGRCNGILVGGVGASIAGLAALQMTFGWEQRWGLFSTAQIGLENALRRCRLELAEAEHAPREERSQMSFDAAKRLDDTAAAIRTAETREFFPQRNPLPASAAPDAASLRPRDGGRGAGG